MTSRWYIPRESTDFVGPIDVIVNGTAVANTVVSLAALPVGQRPVSTDWANPTLQPGAGDATKFGIQVNPVTSRQRLGVWVKIVDNPETPVLEPWQVGWLTRT